MISWILLLSILFAGFVLIIFAKKERYLIVRPDFFLYLSVFIYTIPISLNVLVGNNRLMMQRDNLDIILFCSFLFLIFFLLGFYILPSRQPIKFDTASLPNSYSPLLALFISIIGLVVYLINISKAGGLLTLFILQRAELMETQQGIFAVGILLWKMGILLILSRSILFSNNNDRFYSFIGYFMLISFIILNLILGDRRIMVGLLIGVGFFYILKTKKKISVGKLLLPLIISIFLTHFISKVRHLSSDPIEMFSSIVTTFDKSWLDISEGEVSAVFFVFNDLLEDPNGIQYLYGESYLSMPLLLVPNFIVGQRNYNGLADWFAKTYYYETWVKGGAFGFPYLAETFINFWFFGPIIIGMLTGIGLKLWWNFCCINRPTLFSISLYALSLSMIFTLPRTDFAYVIKEFVLSSFLSIIIIKGWKKIRLK